MEPQHQQGECMNEMVEHRSLPGVDPIVGLQPFLDSMRGKGSERYSQKPKNAGEARIEVRHHASRYVPIAPDLRPPVQFPPLPPGAKKSARPLLSKKPGKYLATTYSRGAFRPTTIGAAAFHFRVRDGTGWFHYALVTRRQFRRFLRNWDSGGPSLGRCHSLTSM